MTIKWNISKKRGFYRPVLTITTTLTNEEMELLGDAILDFKTKIMGHTWNHTKAVNFDEDPDNKLCENFTFQTLYLRRDYKELKIILPLKRILHYPEVEESIKSFREEIEKTLTSAADSISLMEEKEISLTDKTKKHIAPALMEIAMNKSTDQ